MVLLRALLLHGERPEMSWSDVALKSGVHPRTLNRYVKRYADVAAGRLEPAEIPALVVKLEGRVVEAVGKGVVVDGGTGGASEEPGGG